MMEPSVLIIDDEQRLAEVLGLGLRDRGLHAHAASSFAEAESYLKDHTVDLVLSDLRMPDVSGREVLHRLKQSRPDIQVIIMTAYASVRDAVDLVKEGAFDYVVKPFEIDDIVVNIGRALKLRETLEENQRLRGELEQKFRFENLIGDSAAFRRVLEQVAQVCAAKTTVLIHGESGTGKELVARAIHYNSPRAARPFIAVNCAAIPESLLESELFGYAKGAFNGAAVAREGRFAAANGGTLFLDEIGDMALPLQAKVLRAIQDQSFTPVGSDQPIEIDVRVVAATQKDLKQMVEKKEFREDLYYRINVFPIALPALRDRLEDILMLARYFIRSFAEDIGKQIIGLTPAAETAMMAYAWPGNIRELQNCVERAVIVAQGPTIDAPDLPRYVLDPRPGERAEPQIPTDLDGELARLERHFIIEALRKVGGVQVKAAKELGISERSFWHRVKKLGIRIDRVVD